MTPTSVSHPSRFAAVLPRSLRAALLLIAAVAISASGARAQSVPGLHPHTSVTTRITAAVRPILTLAAVEIVDVEHAAAQSVVESRAAIRANMPYRIAVRAAAALNTDRERVVVRDLTGAWVPLSSDRAVIVAEGTAGVNSHEVACRVLPTVDGDQSSTDPQACSLAYELAPSHDGTVVSAVAILPVPAAQTVVASASSHID